MTFLEEVKNEIENIRLKKSCCMASELRAMLMLGGTVYNESVIFGTEDFTLAKRVSSYLAKTCRIKSPERLLEDAESYKFLIGDNILGELELEVDESLMINEVFDTEADACCKKAFVRGAFLASGSIANPEKAYRMEIFSENERAIDKLFDILTGLEVDAKKTKRKNLFVVYTNKCESVADMLKVTECVNSVFKVFDARVQKDYANKINRGVNCEIANMDRAIKSASRELAAIELIKKTIGLDALKPKLKSTAMLRMENPEASIMELCKLSDPPLAKSTLNNRLNTLVKIAEESGEK